MRIKINRKSGFTMLETLFAMLLFGITAGAILRAIPFIMHQEYLMHDRKQAVQVLTSMCEVLRVTTLEQMQDPEIRPRTFTEGKYSGTVVVEPVPFTTSYSRKMVQVSFTLDWDTLGKHSTLTWTTFLAKDGLVTYGF